MVGHIVDGHRRHRIDRLRVPRSAARAPVSTRRDRPGRSAAMGGRGRWLGVLSVATVAALAACEPLHENAPPEWTPWLRIDGKFRPEVEQVPAATTAERRLRVVSFNTLWGVDLELDAGYFTTDPDLADADVIALQEVSRGPGEAKSDAGQLASLLQMGYVFVPTFDWDG